MLKKEYRNFIKSGHWCPANTWFVWCPINKENNWYFEEAENIGFFTYLGNEI